MLVRGWVNDDRFHLHRAVSPDWEWDQVGNWFASHALLALQGANWQRGHGKDADRPQRITPALLRGEEPDDGGDETKNGVKSGRRRTSAVVEVSGAADLASVKDQMRARRRRVG